MYSHLRKGLGIFVDGTRRCTSAQLNRAPVQRTHAHHAISHSPTVLCLAENGPLKVCFWEICWSLRIFSRWNCTVKYMAFILWEREDDFLIMGIYKKRNLTCQNLVRRRGSPHAVSRSHRDGVPMYTYHWAWCEAAMHYSLFT